MNFATLADGATTRALGLLPNEGFWLAIILVGLAIAIDLLLVKSIRDRRVLGMEPVVGATYVLLIISMLCFVGAALILLH